jgi:DNA invertase Pin-like site-specific DNA recombinase
LKGQPIDTSTAAGKCFLDMLGVFAEFETNLGQERQLEASTRPRRPCVYKGRPASIDAERVRKMKADGMGPMEIAIALKVGRGIGLPIACSAKLKAGDAVTREQRFTQHLQRPRAQSDGSRS